MGQGVSGTVCCGEGRSGRGFGPRVAPTRPCPSHVVPLSPGWAAWGGAGRRAWLRISFGQTSPLLCWDERERVRGRKSGGYQREVVIRRKSGREIKCGDHRSDRGDWDRQREKARVGNQKSQRKGVRVRQRKEVRGDGRQRRSPRGWSEKE